jgi:transcriptional regulator with XRE-family HTH domain
MDSDTGSNSYMPQAVGWSQEELGAIANLHRTYIGAIERAEENITVRTLDKLAVALRVAPAEFLRDP